MQKIRLKTISWVYVLVALLTISVAASISWSVFGLGSTSNQAVVLVNELEFKVDVADTAQKRYQGLSGKERLLEDEGMLFVFHDYYMPSFVMREMNFPIDIIWIKDNIVAGIEKNIPLVKDNSQLIRYSPKGFINYALEINAGITDKHNIKIGDSVVINY